MSAAKHTPYWHPRFPTPDGRRYCAITRADAAILLRLSRETRTVCRTVGAHGQRVYVLHTPGMHYEAGRLHMATASAQ